MKTDDTNTKSPAGADSLDRIVRMNIDDCQNALLHIADDHPYCKSSLLAIRATLLELESALKDVASRHPGYGGTGDIARRALHSANDRDHRCLPDGAAGGHSVDRIVGII